MKDNMKAMHIIIMMITTSLFWTCTESDPVTPDLPPIVQDTIFEMEWATRMDFEKEIVNNAQGVFYNKWFIRTGDLDDPAVIFGFDAVTGAKEWEYKYVGWDNSNIDLLYISNGVLLCVTAKRVFGFNVDSKEVIWEKNLKVQNLLRGSGVVASNGKYYQLAYYNFNSLGGFTKKLLEFDVVSGANREAFSAAPDSIGTKSFSPPVIWEDIENNRTLMIFNYYPNAATPPEVHRQEIWAIDMATNEVVWRTEINNGFSSNSLHPPIIYNDLVITGGDWHIYAFNIRSGEQIWTYEETNTNHLSIWDTTNHLIHEGMLYVNATGFNVTCLNAETGELIWNNPKGGPNCTDNMLYYEKEDLLVFTSWGYASVMVLDALTGKILHREYKFDNSSYNNDVVYDEARDLFFVSTFKHAIGFKIHRPK